MKSVTRALPSLTLALVGVSFGSVATDRATTEATVVKGLAPMPFALTQNQGQWDEQVPFQPILMEKAVTLL